LIKQHTGRFTNRVSYWGTCINIGSGGGGTPLSLSGEYASGRLSLQLSAPTRTPPRMPPQSISPCSSSTSAHVLLAKLLSGDWSGASSSATDVTEWEQVEDRQSQIKIRPYVCGLVI
jgi:hypothetical protein